MPDYFDAFKKGLEAVDAAQVARREINEVFAEVDRQLGEGTDGKIKIERKEYYVKPIGLADLAGLASFSYALSGKKRETYWAIIARNPLIPESSEKELAKWSQDYAGYPCRIVWANTEQYCADRESLELALVTLLKDTEVVEKLTVLMRLEPPPPKEEIAQQTDAADKE